MSFHRHVHDICMIKKGRIIGYTLFHWSAFWYITSPIYRTRTFMDGAGKCQILFIMLQPFTFFLVLLAKLRWFDFFHPMILLVEILFGHVKLPSLYTV